jgi:hypothetical protein
MVKLRSLVVFAGLVGALLFSSRITFPKPGKGRVDLASLHPDQTWTPTVLLPWVRYGADFGGVLKWNVRGMSEDRDMDEWLARLSQDGVRCIGWFLFGDGRGALTFDESGYVRGLAPSVLSDYQAVLSHAKKYDLQLVWILTDFEIGMPVAEKGGVQEFGRPDLIEDEAKRKSLIENGLKPILQATGQSEQIAGWIVINEPEHLLRSGFVSEQAMRSFVREATAAIKQFDPGEKVAIANSDLAAMVHLSDLDSLDFLVLHYYEPNLPAPATWIQKYLHEQAGASKPKRPIFIGEFPLRLPPGGNLDRFLQACRAFGYAGAWPWSLRTNSRESDGRATNLNEQFDEAAAYARSVRSLQNAARHDSLDTKKMREWALSELRSELADVQQRVAALQGEPGRQQAEAETNKEWEARARREIDGTIETLNSDRKQQQRAQSDIIENELWVSRADPNDRAAAQAALKKSRDWLLEIQSQIRSAQEEILKEQRDLATAEERIRMHSYLAGEAVAELSWLEALRARLGNKRSLKSATGGRI